MRSGLSARDARAPGLLALPGLVFLCLALLEVILLGSVTSTAFLLSVGSGLLLLGAAYGVGRTGLPSARYPRILWWSIAGALGVSLVTLLLVVTPRVTISEPFVSVVAGLGVGAVSGFLAGYNEARALERGRQAERQRSKAEHAERKQAEFEYLNHLLRHDILNNVNVIQGRAELLAERDVDDPEGHVSTILRQAQSATALIQNVRAYLESTDDATLGREDLSETLAREVSTLRSSYPNAVVTTEVPEDLHVRADDLLNCVFSNLLRNAVVHNEGEDVRVSISAERSGGEVTVTVADDGPGIPPDVREDLFAKTDRGDHGFGLYIVDALVARYGGSVRVESTGADGTTFAVTLVAASSSGTVEAKAPAPA